MDFFLSKIMNRSIIKSQNNLDNEIITNNDQINNPTESLNKQINANNQVEIGNVQQKETTNTLVTKKLNEENGQQSFNITSENLVNLNYIEGNNVLNKKNNINVENSSPNELKSNLSHPAPLPDIVNVLPTIAVNESSNQFYKKDQITSNILHETEKSGKLYIPSGPSSSISSDDELFVECETYASIIDKTQKLSSTIQNDINFPKRRNEENSSIVYDINLKEFDSNNIGNYSEWENVLSSVSSQNVENLENSKIDLDISPQNLNVCLDSTHNIIVNNVESQIDNNKNVNDQLIAKDNNIENVVDPNIIESSSEPISSHIKIIDTENNLTFDTTFDENAAVVTEARNTVDNILSEQLANLQLSDFSNSLNSTVIENSNSIIIDSNLNKTVNDIEPKDNLELISSNNDNEPLNNVNLTTDIKMCDLSHMKEITLDDNQPIQEENLIKNHQVDKVENSITSQNLEIVTDTTKTLSLHDLRQSKLTDSSENECIVHSLNVTVSAEEKVLPITSKLNDNTIEIINSQTLNKTANIPLSQELAKLNLTDHLQNDILYNDNDQNLNETHEIISADDYHLNETFETSKDGDAQNLNKTHEIISKDGDAQNLNETHEIISTDDCHQNETLDMSKVNNAKNINDIHNVVFNDGDAQNLNETNVIISKEGDAQNLNETHEIISTDDCHLNEILDMSKVNNVKNINEIHNVVFNDGDAQNLNETHMIISKEGDAQNLNETHEIISTDDFHLNETLDISKVNNAKTLNETHNVVSNDGNAQNLNETHEIISKEGDAQNLNETHEIISTDDYHLNETLDISKVNNAQNLNETHNVLSNHNNKQNLNVTHDIFSKTNKAQNLNETQNIVSKDKIETNDILPRPESVVSYLDGGTEVKTDLNKNNDLVKTALTTIASNNTDDLNLNFTIDITEPLNDPKTRIPKKSPTSLKTIYEASSLVDVNLNMTHNLPLPTIIKKSDSINELNINSGSNSSNLKFVESGSQGKLDMTFTASTEALNSTINVPMSNDSNLPIISSVVDRENNSAVHKNSGNENFEVNDEDFQSNGMILNAWDFDFLLSKGNNNNNVQVDRSSLLLKFDPLVGRPQIIQQYQQELLPNQGQQQHLQQQKLISSVTSPSQGRLSPAVEEEEYFDVVTKSSLLDITKQNNLIDTNTGNSFTLDTQLGAIKTEIVQIDNKMSIDVVREMKTENNLISTDNDTNCTDVKHDIKMEDFEKKIQNEVLKRTEEIGKKLKDVEQREEALLRRITEKDKTTAKMGSVIEAYEKAIAEMIAEKEEITHNYERQLAEIKSERDLNYQHLASLESTFADLHVKYERSKQITAKLKANEEESCAARKQFLENLRLQEQRYEKMKNHAMQQLEIANNKLEFLTKNHSSELTKLKALLKKEEISRGSISEQLQQKTRENEELVKICDELINGQGS